MASIIYKGKQESVGGGGGDSYFSLTTIIDNNNSPIKNYANNGVRFTGNRVVPSQLTFCAWIKTSAERVQLLLTNNTFLATSTNTFPFRTNITSTGELAFGIDNGDADFSPNDIGTTSGVDVITNSWQHIGIVYKGNDYFRFYVNGTQVMNQSITSTANNPGTLDWCFGIPHQWNAASPNDYAFNGDMAYLIFAPGFVDEGIITDAYEIAP